MNNQSFFQSKFRASKCYKGTSVESAHTEAGAWMELAPAERLEKCCFKLPLDTGMYMLNLQIVQNSIRHFNSWKLFFICIHIITYVYTFIYNDLYLKTNYVRIGDLVL